MANIQNSDPNVPQDNDHGPYFQGWNAIAEQLALRIRALNFTDKIHCHIKFIKANSNTREWQREFAETREDKPSAKPFVNVVMFNRDGYPVSKNSKDDSRWMTRRSTCEMHVVYSFPNFEKWHWILDRILQDLTHGDRTLSQTCLTYSLPDEGTSDLVDFGGIDCHRTIIKFRIEEAGMVTP